MQPDDAEELVCLAVMHALRAHRLTIAAMTPAAVCDAFERGRWTSARLSRLAAAGTFRWPVSATCPFPLPPAGSPASAAAQAGVTIDPEAIVDAFDVLATWADTVVVQGVGGLGVALGPKLAVKDVARHLRLPLILALRADASADARAAEALQMAEALGLRIAGWVATGLGEEGQDQAALRAMHRQLSAAPCLGCLFRSTTDGTAASRLLDSAQLLATLRVTTSH